MQSKKGVTEVDWAMSMSIFLLYIAWLFIVVKPSFSPESKATLPFDDLKDSFYGEAAWTVNKTPIIIRSNITGENEPIIAKFPYTGYEGEYSISGNYMDIDDGRIFFLADLYSGGYDSTIVQYLLHSTSNYTQTEIYSDLVSSEESASTADININFDDGMVEQGFYNDAIRIMDYYIDIDGTSMDTSKTSHLSNSLLSKHKVSATGINHTTYILLNNSRLYNYFDSTEDKQVKVAVRIDRYPYFYIDSATSGAIDYNTSTCDSYTTDYIDFYDNAYGLAFIFDNEVELGICHKGNLSVTAEFDVGGEFGYQLMFHERDTEMENMKQPYHLIWGADEVLEGLSAQSMFNLKQKNYTYMQDAWGYPYAFNITVLNETENVLYSFGTYPYEFTTTSAKSYNYRLLSQSGTMERVKVVVLSW